MNQAVLASCTVCQSPWVMLGAAAAILFVGVCVGAWKFGEKQNLSNPRMDRPPKG